MDYKFFFIMLATISVSTYLVVKLVVWFAIKTGLIEVIPDDSSKHPL